MSVNLLHSTAHFGSSFSQKLIAVKGIMSCIVWPTCFTKPLSWEVKSQARSWNYSGFTAALIYKLRWLSCTGQPDAVLIITYQVHLSFPNEGMWHVCLCFEYDALSPGVCNGDPSDDLKTQNMTIITNMEEIEMFIKSWEIEKSLDVTTRRPVRNCTEDNCSYCMELLNRSTFSPCHKKVSTMIGKIAEANLIKVV